MRLVAPPLRQTMAWLRSDVAPHILLIRLNDVHVLVVNLQQ